MSALYGWHNVCLPVYFHTKFSLYDLECQYLEGAEGAPLFFQAAAQPRKSAIVLTAFTGKTSIIQDLIPVESILTYHILQRPG